MYERRIKTVRVHRLPSEPLRCHLRPMILSQSMHLSPSSEPPTITGQFPRVCYHHLFRVHSPQKSQQPCKKAFLLGVSVLTGFHRKQIYPGTIWPPHSRLPSAPTPGRAVSIPGFSQLPHLLTPNKTSSLFLERNSHIRLGELSLGLSSLPMV